MKTGKLASRLASKLYMTSSDKQSIRGRMTSDEVKTLFLETTGYAEVKKSAILNRMTDYNFLNMSPGPSRVLAAFSISTNSLISGGIGDVCGGGVRFWKVIVANLDILRAKFRHQWPDWCYLPSFHWACSMGHGLLLQRTESIAASEKDGHNSMVFKDYLASVYMYLDTFACMAMWRMTKGVFKFDLTLWDLVVHTPFAGNLPSDVLLRLPEWCVYIEIPKEYRNSPLFYPILGDSLKKYADGDKLQQEDKIHGFFAYLDYPKIPSTLHETEDLKLWKRLKEQTNQRTDVVADLIILINTESYQNNVKWDDKRTPKDAMTLARGGDAPIADFPLLHRIVVNLGDWTLTEGLSSIVKLMSSKVDADRVLAESAVYPFINVLLYLCSINADITHGKTGKAAAFDKHKVRKSSTINCVREWDVGTRMGQTYRLEQNHFQKTMEELEVSSDSVLPDTVAVEGQDSEALIKPYLKKRPHWRKAHWHTYWVGKKDDKSTLLKWIPPVLVNSVLTEVDKLPIVNHTVKL